MTRLHADQSVVRRLGSRRRWFLKPPSTCFAQVFLGVEQCTFQVCGCCCQRIWSGSRSLSIRQTCPNHCRRLFWIASSIVSWSSPSCQINSFRSGSCWKTPRNCLRHRIWKTSSLLILDLRTVQVSAVYSNIGIIKVRKRCILVTMVMLAFCHRHHLSDATAAVAWLIQLRTSATKAKSSLGPRTPNILSLALVQFVHLLNRHLPAIRPS